MEKEYKLGEEITLETQLNDEDLYKEVAVVTETSEPTCEGCTFADRANACTLLLCSAGCRSDKKNVIFKSKSIEMI